MVDKSPRRRTTTLIAIAAVAGVAAGAVAVYVMEGTQGNGTDTAAVDCTAAQAMAAAAAPHATGDVAAFRVASEPRYLGDLSFKTDDGQETTLAGLGDKMLLVNLWATWCVPCRTEMPALDRLEADLGGSDFQVVAVNIDKNNTDRARAFYEEIEIANLAFFADETTDVFSEMKKQGLALGLPTTVLVDAQGCEIGSLQGPAEWDSEDAKALINAALGA